MSPDVPAPESHLAPVAAAAVPAREQVDRPAPRHTGRQTGSGNLTGKHGGDKAQDLSEGHQVPVRGSGRVGAAASSHANVLMLTLAVSNEHL